MGQQRAESQSLDALRQDQQQIGQAQGEQRSLDTLHGTQPANDNQQRTPDNQQRDGREALFGASEQPGQENGHEQEFERDGREALFRPNGTEHDAQEGTQTQEQSRERQMELDR